MKIVRDYSEQHKKMVEKLMEQPCRPLSETTKRMGELVGDLTDAILSQYEAIPDEQKKQKVENEYFSFLDYYARVVGGCVVMNSNEELGVTTLEFRGEEIVFTEINSSIGEFSQFSQLIKNAESFSVSAKESRFIIQFTYNWMSKKKVRDHSERIELIRNQMRKIRQNEEVQECYM